VTPRRRKTLRLAPWHADWLTVHHLARGLRRAAARALGDLGTVTGDPLLVLDLGCGERPWEGLFGRARCIGLDIGVDGARPDVIAQGEALPFAEGAFDIVFSSQVLEHVPEHRAALHECARTLRSGGQLVLSVPFYWPLHEEPQDLRRFTNHGLRRELEDAGFDDISIQPDTGSLTMVSVAALGLMPRRRGAWLLMAPLVLLVNLGTLLAQHLSADRRSPLNWVVNARRKAR
jgi:SAM-dependent methyltransferase